MLCFKNLNTVCLRSNQDDLAKNWSYVVPELHTRGQEVLCFHGQVVVYTKVFDRILRDRSPVYVLEEWVCAHGRRPRRIKESRAQFIFKL